MKKVNQMISERYASLTKGQRLLAAFVTEHCEKAAFMSSFDLAGVTGVSQSSVIRFAGALGYAGFSEFQQALRTEVKYRLSALERFEVLSAAPSDSDVLEGVAAADARNIKKNASLHDTGALKNLCTRLSLASKVYVYGQGAAAAASVYLSTYLRGLLANVVNVNQGIAGPLAELCGINSGDLFVCITFPPLTSQTGGLLRYARSKEASVVTISEGQESEAAALSDLNLTAECGEFGVNGTLAPVISLCGAIVCLMVRGDERAQEKLRDASETDYILLENG